MGTSDNDFELVNSFAIRENMCVPIHGVGICLSFSLCSPSPLSRSLFSLSLCEFARACLPVPQSINTHLVGSYTLSFQWALENADQQHLERSKNLQFVCGHMQVMKG
jgi:hypothetical protein